MFVCPLLDSSGKTVTLDTCCTLCFKLGRYYRLSKLSLPFHVYLYILWCYDDFPKKFLPTIFCKRLKAKNFFVILILSWCNRELMSELNTYLTTTLNRNRESLFWSLNFNLSCVYVFFLP